MSTTITIRTDDEDVPKRTKTKKQASQKTESIKTFNASSEKCAVMGCNNNRQDSLTRCKAHLEKARQYQSKYRKKQVSVVQKIKDELEEEKAKSHQLHIENEHLRKNLVQLKKQKVYLEKMVMDAQKV